MENYIVSARKYRPQTFRTVVGQQHITNTLKNAIISNHLAQAFLFCGPRGVVVVDEQALDRQPATGIVEYFVHQELPLLVRVARVHHRFGPV